MVARPIAAGGSPRRNGLRWIRQRLALFPNIDDQEPCAEPENRGRKRQAHANAGRPETTSILGPFKRTRPFGAHGVSPQAIAYVCRSSRAVRWSRYSYYAATDIHGPDNSSLFESINVPTNQNGQRLKSSCESFKIQRAEIWLVTCHSLFEKLESRL